MKYSYSIVVLAAALLIGCVTSNSEGGKPLKQDDPKEAAAKYNIAEVLQACWH